MKPLILSEEHKRQLTEWFGPNPADWAGHQVTVYRKVVRDADGKKIGETIGMCLPGETPPDLVK